MTPIVSRRFLFVFGFVVVVLLAAMVCLLSLPGSPDVWMTPENYSRIEKGMSLDDVEQIVWSPPGDYSVNQEFGVARARGRRRNSAALEELGRPTMDYLR